MQRRTISTLLISAALILAGALPASADSSGGSNVQRSTWESKAKNIGDYESGYLDAAWADPNHKALVPVEVTTTVTQGPSTVEARSSGAAITTLLACGTRQTAWVEINKDYTNYTGQVLFNLRTRKNYSYDGCRVWNESVVTTPGTSTLGSFAWSYDTVTASTDGYEYLNGSSYGRGYSERTARWNGAAGAGGGAVSLWTRCHAEYNNVTGCASGEN